MPCFRSVFKIRKKAKIRNRYNHVPHLTQDTTWKSDKNTKKTPHIVYFIQLSSYKQKTPGPGHHMGK